MSQLLWALKTSLKDLFQVLLNKFPFNKEMYMLSKRLSTEEKSQSFTTWTDLQYTQSLIIHPGAALHMNETSFYI